MTYGPKLPFSERLHAEKYRAEGESFEEAMNRVASALKDDDKHYKAFRDILLDMRFLPAGRVQAAMGSSKNVTPYNCYVSGVIEDSFVEGGGSIMQRAAEAAQTMRMGGGIGYDFSRLRPRGALIKKLNSKSSGPVSFMSIFDAVCKCVASSGHRRGAQMGVFRVDHPDIEEFIHAKNNKYNLTGFNISVAITDEFMHAVSSGAPFPLRWGGETFREVNPRSLWENIMRSTWDWAEPGVMFIDRINEMNNLWYCETLEASNPCGEQPLPPFGACLLGSFNLVKYLFKTHEDEYGFDYFKLARDIEVVTRAMDNVVDRAIYPLKDQEHEAKLKRRMGLGITGLANAGEALGFKYGSADFIRFEEEVLRTIALETYHTSVSVALDKGSFPMLDREKYLQGKFIQHLTTQDPNLEMRIRKHGIRNSHLTSVAPTGTISLCADNVSSGIEPVFDYEFERTIIDFEGPRVERVVDYGVRELGVNGTRAKDVSVGEHVGVLVAAQKWVDSAVSKTVNIPKDYKWEDFKNVYFDAWRRGAKGCSTFRVGGLRDGVLNSKTEELEAMCRIDNESGRRECD